MHKSLRLEKNLINEVNKKSNMETKLLLENNNLKLLLNQYITIIKKIKELIGKLTIKKNDDPMTYIIINLSLNELKDILKHENEKLLKLKTKTNMNYNINLTKFNDIINPLKEKYDYESENNFLLLNEIKYRDNIIKNLRSEFLNSKKYINFVDETFVNYNNKAIKIILQNELNDLNASFNKINKKQKSIRKKTRKTTIKKENLYLKLKEGQRFLTEQNCINKEFIKVKDSEYLFTFDGFENDNSINSKNNLEDSINSTNNNLIFNSSEKDNSSELNENESIINEEFDLKGNQLLTDPKVNELTRQPSININNKINLIKMPKLNLKQINYNKSKIEINLSSEEIKKVAKQYKMSRAYQIQKLKRKIEKLIIKINENKNIIKKFNNFIKKIKYYYLFKNEIFETEDFEEFKSINNVKLGHLNYFNIQTEPNYIP